MSPFQRAKALESQLRAIASNFDADAMRPAERDILRSLKSLTTDVRLDMRDYGMADTKAEQDKLAAIVRKRLDQLEHMIVKAGSHDIIGAVDVAQFSAEAQQIMADL
jgi:chemotaxis regulatin CheY-phosphate phosphatase CheZ